LLNFSERATELALVATVSLIYDTKCYGANCPWGESSWIKTHLNWWGRNVHGAKRIMGEMSCYLYVLCTVYIPLSMAYGVVDITLPGNMHIIMCVARDVIQLASSMRTHTHTHTRAEVDSDLYIIRPKEGRRKYSHCHIPQHKNNTTALYTLHCEGYRK